MEKDKKTRIKRLIIITTAVLLVGVAYYVFIKITGNAAPCIVYKSTGFYCAACGITRMFVALFELDIITAARNNLLALLLIIPVIVFALNRGIKYVKYGALKFTKPEKFCVIILIILLVVFTALRNIQSLDFLRPIQKHL